MSDHGASQRWHYRIGGLIVGAAVDVVLDLLAAAIQQQALADRFGPNAIPRLVVFALLGLLVGYWLSGPVPVPASAVLPNPQPQAGTVTITRLRALLSYIKLRGQGISLIDLLLIRSQLDIDTRTEDAVRHH